MGILKSILILYLILMIVSFILVTIFYNLIIRIEIRRIMLNLIFDKEWDLEDNKRNTYTFQLATMIPPAIFTMPFMFGCLLFMPVEKILKTLVKAGVIRSFNVVSKEELEKMQRDAESEDDDGTDSTN